MAGAMTVLIIGASAAGLDLLASAGFAEDI